MQSNFISSPPSPAHANSQETNKIGNTVCQFSDLPGKQQKFDETEVEIKKHLPDTNDPTQKLVIEVWRFALP